MIINKGKKLVFATALIMGGLVGQPAFSASFDVRNVAENDSLNLRAGAGVVNDIVTIIPHDGTGIELAGEEVVVGNTHWVMVSWEGVTGWVSKYYLQERLEESAEETAQSETPEVDVTENDISADEEVVQEQAEDINAQAVLDSGPTKDVWVLQCGNKTPFWKVELLPESMSFYKGDYETNLKITAKQQDKNRWNTALKTVVTGQNGRNNLKMTIKYAYSRRCYDTLSGLRVPYKVVTDFNGEELSGCCRAVKVAMPDVDETKLSMK